MTNLRIHKTKYFAEFALIFATVIWGGTFVIIKESLDDVSTLLFISIRFIFASLLLLPFLVKRKKLITKSLLKEGTLLGFFLFLGFAFQTIGLKYTTATRSGFLTGISVIIIPFLQLIIEKRPPTKGTIAGTILVFFGLAFLSSKGDSIFSVFSEIGTNFNFGDFLTLLCTIFFATQIVLIDIVSKKYDFVSLLFVQLATVGILSALGSILFDVAMIEELKLIPTNYLIFGIFYTGLLATLFNIGIQTKFQKEITPTKAGIIFSFEPIFSALFAFFLLNEKITNFGLIGSMMIFLGLIVSETYEKMRTVYERRYKTS